MSKKSRTQSVPVDDSSSSNESSSSYSSRRSSTPARERLYKSAMCGLNMPVPRIKAMLKVHNYAGRVSDTSAVFLTGVLEYMTAEILEHSRNAARSCGRSRIQSKHINMAIKTDPEFRQFFRNAIVLKGGVVPYREQNCPTVAGSQPPAPPLAPLNPLPAPPVRSRARSKPKRAPVRKPVRKSRASRRSG